MFQMAVRHRCEFLSADHDPGRVIEVTQRKGEQFAKAQQLLGVSVPMGDGEKIPRRDHR